MNRIEWGNPYSHEEHCRNSYPSDELRQDETCAWCGNRNAKDGLFEYYDTGVKFCSKGCFKAYYD